MSNNGPTFTKATYDHKRQRCDPPSPGKISSELNEAKRIAEQLRTFNERVTVVGLYGALSDRSPERFPAATPTPLTRRRV